MPDSLLELLLLPLWALAVMLTWNVVVPDISCFAALSYRDAVCVCVLVWLLK